MTSRTLLIFFLFPVFLFSFAANQRPAVEAGSIAPEFSAEATNGKLATNELFKNKYYAFILEGQSHANKNYHVRMRLESIISMLPAEKRSNFVFFTVADVSSIISLVHGIVRSRVRSSEKENKVTIYMDFKGHILNNFQLSQDNSNFVLVDNNGIIRYKKIGIVTDEELNKISNYLAEQFQAPYLNAPLDVSAAYSSGEYIWKPYLP